MNWTSQFVSEIGNRDRLEEFVPSRFLPYLTSQAPVAQLSPPDMQVLEDTTTDGIRRLRMRITSVRQAPVLLIRADSPIEILAVSIAGKTVGLERTPLSLSTDDPWLLRYFGLPKEGLDISLDIRSSGSIKLRAIDQSYGLTQIDGHSYNQRPDYLMPTPILDSDSTFVGKLFTF